MKTIQLLFFAMLAFNFAHAQTEDRGYLVKIGDPAPDFSTILDDGSTFKLSEQKGKVVMLQFTASWCSVCRKEMPYIEKDIWLPLKGKDLVLIGIDRDEPVDKIQEFKIQTKITYPLGLDPGGEIFQKYALKDAGVTRNIIIDKKGNIVYLTRLFDMEEFEKMKSVLYTLTNSK